MMYKGVLYQRINIINGKQYIGQTINPQRRNYDFYVRERKYGGNYINNARKKYGSENFETNILTTIYSNDKDELHNTLDKLEKIYIDVFNTKVPNGYNISDGGSGSKGHKKSPQVIEKLRELAKNRIISDETRKRLSESHKGLKLHPVSAELKKLLREKSGKKVNMYDLNHNFIKSFLSIRECANELKIDHTAISRCCRNKQKTSKGYIFQFDTDTTTTTTEEENKN